MISDCKLLKGFLPKDFADSLFNQLLNQLNWEQPSIRIFGKFVPIPRLQVLLAGEHCNSHYKYSGTNLTPFPFSNPIYELKDYVENHLKQAFNTALVNLYRDGNDSVGWHADDESLLGKKPVIASISLGASRNLHFRNIYIKSQKYKYLLENGDLFIMGPTVQSQWQHAILKEKGVTKPRINITFRNVE